MQKTPIYKRCLPALLALVLMAVPMLSLAEEYLVVKGGQLNLRKEASTSSSVIAQYPTGTWMTVTESADEWSKVKVDGKEGFVMSKYLSSASDKSTMYVRTNTGAGLNMRTSPSLEGSIMGSYKPGTKVEVLLKGNGWYKVSVENSTGYMASRYLNKSQSSGGSGSENPGTGYPKTGIVNNPGANQVLLLRETASTDARVIGYYGNGVQVKLLGESGNFYKVTVDGKNGYMMKKFIKVSTSGSTPSFPEAPFAAKLFNPNGNSIVNFRKSPSLSGSIIKAYPVGTEIQVLELGQDWFKVEIEGTEGYVSRYFITTK